MRDKKLTVMKFGGTSVGDAESIAQATQIARGAVTGELAKLGGMGRAFGSPQTVVAVVSAMSGVTDSLVKAATSAAGRDGQTFRQVKESLLDRHRAVIEAIVEDSEARSALLGEIEALLHEFESLCQSIYILGELTGRGLDAVSSLGERLLVRVFAAALRSLGVKARSLEATTLIVTDNNYGGATPLMDETRARVQANLVPLLAEGITPVVTGFIGATADGVLTTLGRGGSDYSASILGACLEADEIWIWTDVDGVMSADPRVVPDARTLPQLSYDEVAELAYFGARVVHPKTTLPSAKQGIPLYIRNTFNPYPPGTLINDKQQVAKRRLKAITAISGLSLVSVGGRGMAGIPGVAARTLTAIASTQTNVFMISQSSSQQNIYFVVPKDNIAGVVQAIEEELELERTRGNVEHILPQEGVVIVAMVGAGLTDVHLVLPRAITALGRAEIDIIAIAQGASKYSISLVVSEHDADKAVRVIHREFRMGGTRRKQPWRPH